MKFGFCATDYDEIKKIKNADFDYVEVSVKDILTPLCENKRWEKIRKKIKSYNFPIEAANSFLDIKIIGQGLDERLISDYLKSVFLRAKKLGVKIIVLGSGNVRRIPVSFTGKEALSQLREFLDKALFYAEKTGIIIALEPLNKKETNFINSIKEAGKIIKNVNSPYLKLAADTYHMIEEKENLESLYAYKDRLAHIHISDTSRQYPGFGGYDFNELFNFLKKIDYNGRISLECGSYDCKNAEKALNYLKGCLILR